MEERLAERVGFEFKASNLAFSALDIGYAAFVPPALPLASALVV